jgi:hypothetical protein
MSGARSTGYRYQEDRNSGYRRQVSGCRYRVSVSIGKQLPGLRHEAYSSFEDLEVFQKANRISLEIHQASLGFPSNEHYGLGDQIRKASKSICANLAEGFAKQRSYSKSKNGSRYLTDCGWFFSDEMRVWLAGIVTILGYCR